MFKKNIAVDIDCVIGDSDKIFRKHINKYFDINLKKEDITHYYYDKVLGISQKQIEKFWDYFTEKKLWLDIPLLPLAKSSIDYLNDKYDVIIISSRDEKIKDITEKWLDKYKIKYKNLILLKKAENKLSKILQKNIDLHAIIEDRLDIAKSFSKEGIKVFLFNYQWNQNGKKHLNKNIIRVNGWRGILSYL